MGAEKWEHLKTKPEYTGIAKEIQQFSMLYTFDATVKNIKFTNRVTMGFTSIKIKRGRETFVGLCTYGKNFREIDIDLDYWDKSTWTTRRSLVYHEMNHCLCGRGHTWSGGTYPEIDHSPDKNPKKVTEPPNKKEAGLLDDGCPASIMYPYILNDECASKHWDLYSEEMFDGCDPY